MYRRMLVPLDGSKLAEVVLPYARQLGNSLGLAATFLHVCGAGESPSAFMCRTYVDHVAEKSGIQSNKAEAKGEVVTGSAAEAILQFAREGNYDLVLMATHGRSGIGRWVMGSVAHKVLAASQVPVMLVRAGAQNVNGEWPKTILIPLDGSQYAEAVLPHIETLVKQGGTNAALTLLKVCEPPDLLADYPEAIMPLTWEEHVKYATATSRGVCSRYLDTVQERLEASGINAKQEILLGDKAAEEITKYVEHNHFDLIAMSTHGRSGISAPYGHVADRILHSVLTPLLLVRPIEPTEIK